MGMTGFDSKVNEIVSMSSIVILTRKKSMQILNGENNYALAA
tara:strand:- start:2115 stop:2240 length:126 start_codon:yes stop_codon:yes gene_type:complete